MMRFEELNEDIVRQYRYEIAQFYYGNMETCSCLEYFTFDQAYKKIGEMIAHLTKNTCIAYGAFEENEIIGYIWAYPHRFREERRMYINECSVKEGYQRKGIGKTMIALIEKRAKESGFTALYLHAEAGSRNAIHFYETIGYRKERIQFRKEITL